MVPKRRLLSNYYDTVFKHPVDTPAVYRVDAGAREIGHS